MYCSKCGTQNDDNNFRCTSCKQILHDAPQPARPVQADSGIATLIPYRNGAALSAYYLGVFSFIPFLGIFLGLAGFVLGMKGRNYAIAHPEAKGTVHAWIGILLGGFFGFGYLILTIILIVAALQKG